MAYDRYGRKLKRRRTWRLLPLLLIGTGVVGAALAAPTCSKFLPTTTVTKVKNRVSKSTADAWAKWRIAHPNWKPNPKVVRPKYIMTTKEAVAKVEFACQAIVEPVPTPEIQLAMVDTPEIVLPPMAPVEYVTPTPEPTPDNTDYPSLSNYVPPIVVGGTPPLTLTAPPPPLAPTPEPGSLWLMGTGLLALGFVVRSRKKVVAS